MACIETNAGIEPEFGSGSNFRRSASCSGRYAGRSQRIHTKTSTYERSEIVVVEIVLTIQRIGSKGCNINRSRCFISVSPSNNRSFNTKVCKDLVVYSVTGFYVKQNTAFGSFTASHSVTKANAHTESFEFLGNSSNGC